MSNKKFGGKGYQQNLIRSTKLKKKYNLITKIYACFYDTILKLSTLQFKEANQLDFLFFIFKYEKQKEMTNL